MKNICKLILFIYLFTITSAFPAGKLQNEDFKSLSELTGAGGSASQLLNDSKIYVTANGINDQLSNAITNGLIGGAGGGGYSLLSGADNPGFESGTGQWTASGGTFTAISSGQLYGSKSGQWTASASGQTLYSNLKTIITGLKGANCMGAISYQYSGASGDYSLVVSDGTNVLASLSLDASSVARDAYVTFVCPSSGSLKVGLLSNVSSPSAIIVDGPSFGGGQVVLGSNSLVTSISQAQFVGSVSVSGCSSQWSSTSTSFADFSAQTGCTYTTAGSALAPATNIPAIRFASLPPGNYLLQFEGQMWSANPTDGAKWQFWDGTNTSLEQSSTQNATVATATWNGITQSISYTTAQTNVTLSIRVKTGSGNTWNIDGRTGIPGVIKVYRFPSSTSQALNAGDTPWYIDANISGSNLPSLGSANVGTAADLNASGLSLTQNSGSASTLISCASTTDNTGSGCGGTNPDLGMTFTPPRAGAYLACASFTHFIDDPSGQIYPQFQINETANGSQTVSVGGTPLQSGGAALSTVLFPHRACAVFNWNSSARRTIRLMYLQTGSSGTITTNAVLTNTVAGLAARSVHWEVYPVTGQQPAPVLIGSVITKSSGVVRQAFWASAGTTACTSSPCTVGTSTGDISIVRNSTGNYTATFSPAFGGQPACSFGGTPGFGSAFVTAISASSVTFGYQNNALAAADSAIYMQCSGPN